MDGALFNYLHFHILPSVFRFVYLSCHLLLSLRVSWWPDRRLRKGGASVQAGYDYVIDKHLV